MLEIAERGQAITHGNPAIVGNTEFALKVRLRVEPEGEPAFEVETRLRFPQMGVPSAGMRLPVVYDPEDPDDLMLDEAGSVYSPNLRPDQEESIRVAHEMALAGRSPEEISAAVDAIRARAGQPPAQVIGGGPATPPDPVEQLSRLADLHARGMLTDEEFSAAKARLLA